MNTKFCPKCGKELPVESVFCPYCMTKLIDVNTGEPIKIKKYKYILPIVIIAIVIMLAVAGIIMFFAFRDSGDKPNDSSRATSAPTEITTTEAVKADYSSYIGLWCDKDSDIENMTENGGNLLEIISVKDDVVRFTFTKTSTPAFNRIARISNVTSQIIDGTGTFTFDNDNWLNSGTGKIKLLDNEIYIETNITKRNDSANWDIGGTFYLTKSDNSVIDFKNYDYLGADFNEVKNNFGEETEEVVSASGKWDIHSYSGFNVTVLQETNKIVSITVEYSSNSLTKSNLCYGTLNGTSTYDDVYAEMGEPTYNSLSYGDVAYVVDGNYLSFGFDENMNLTTFTLQLENTH
ncbi:zinc-ribbon domain-containing protein [Ruminococcus sp.]